MNIGSDFFVGHPPLILKKKQHAFSYYFFFLLCFAFGERERASMKRKDPYKIKSEPKRPRQEGPELTLFSTPQLYGIYGNH